MDAAITLPANLNGNFILNGKSWLLKPGTNKIQVP
jgi:hypothetical protein